MNTETTITAVLAYTVAGVWAIWMILSAATGRQPPSGLNAVMMLVTGAYFGERAIRSRRGD